MKKILLVGLMLVTCSCPAAKKRPNLIAVGSLCSIMLGVFIAAKFDLPGKYNAAFEEKDKNTRVENPAVTPSLERAIEENNYKLVEKLIAQNNGVVNVPKLGPILHHCLENGDYTLLATILHSSQSNPASQRALYEERNGKGLTVMDAAFQTGDWAAIGVMKKMGYPFSEAQKQALSAAIRR